MQLAASCLPPNELTHPKTQARARDHTDDCTAKRAVLRNMAATVPPSFSIISSHGQDACTVAAIHHKDLNSNQG